MPDYETLDAIADAYIPSLGLIWLAVSLAAFAARSWRLGGWRLLLGLSGLAVGYAVMFLDEALGIWPRLGLDYSTHTALAIAFVAVNGRLLPRLWALWGASLAAYMGLMLYQEYHSALDVLTTAAVVAPAVFVLHRPIAAKMSSRSPAAVQAGMPAPSSASSSIEENNLLGP
jgi:hypothetical protein